MQFTLTIDCDNAAFGSLADDKYGEDTEELESCLQKVITKLANGQAYGTVHDSNGNTVGRFELKED